MSEGREGGRRKRGIAGRAATESVQEALSEASGECKHIVLVVQALSILVLFIAIRLEANGSSNKGSLSKLLARVATPSYYLSLPAAYPPPRALKRATRNKGHRYGGPTQCQVFASSESRHQGLLQPSTSLPVLRTTPDLVGVRRDSPAGVLLCAGG